MSKNRDINSPTSFGESPPDVEALLKLAAPESVSLDRDALLFQAGYAANARRHRFSTLWPSVAAAFLLLLSCGLTIALLREHGVSNSLRAEIAASNSVNSKAIVQTAAAPANLAASSAASEASLSDAAPAGSLRNLRLRSWQRLASGSVLPPGQLTALGDYEEQSELQRAAVARTTLPRRDSTTKPKPATYLELRAQQEG
jgi:hypothetical protein